MGMFDFLGGGAMRRDVEQGTENARQWLIDGKNDAYKNINAGYQQGGNYLSGARGAITGGAASGQAALRSGQRNALAALQPYQRSGNRANTMYGNALGLNGVQAQRNFGNNYAASDPFRAQNADMANEALMRVLNARGMSGSGFAGEAVARQSLARGSEDYNNYLDRLAGLQSQGQNTAGQIAGIRQNTAQGMAGLGQNRSNALMQLAQAQANNATGRGNTIADLLYGYAQQNANLDMDLANAKAATRNVGINNFMNLASLGTKAFTAGMGGA